jgi:hypothetical protein
MEGLFEDKLLGTPDMLSPRNELVNAIPSPSFERSRAYRGDVPLESPASETEKLETSGAIESKELMDGKLGVFRLGLDLTILALQDERNRRWFEVSAVERSRPARY